MSDAEVDQIKRDTFEAIKDSKVLMIVETEQGWDVRDWMLDGVAPTSTYPTKREAVARLLQLLHVGPVAPQTWPETACIGSIGLSANEGDANCT